MITKDAASEKLLASIDKTKTATTTQLKTTKKKVVKKAVQRSINKQTTAKKVNKAKEQLVDLFQSGRRVWPD